MDNVLTTHMELSFLDEKKLITRTQKGDRQTRLIRS